MTDITRDSTKQNLAKRLAQLREMDGDAAKFMAQSVAGTIDLLIDLAVEAQLRQYILRHDITLGDYHAAEERDLKVNHLSQHSDRGSPREAEEAGRGDRVGDRPPERSEDPKEEEVR